jgi:uncharacterized protein (UPF0332 family)
VNDAVSRAYHAAAHLARAVLLTEGVEPKSHAELGRMLGLHFPKPTTIGFVLTLDGATEEVDVAARFCNELRDWLGRNDWL